ncbi:hypothetical protein AM500_20240 [Bacillus sp. FJAT-18017]|nr:hypothetical protein AM500_20240 [Bacillus sp. FJAT-18017]
MLENLIIKKRLLIINLNFKMINAMRKNSTLAVGFQRVCGWCEQTARHLEWTFEPRGGNSKYVPAYAIR